jgi:hypothetical protein
MVGPDGEALYERVTGVSTFLTDLTLPGWPAATEEGLLGLNPDVRYALVPGAHDRTSVQVTGMPEDTMIGRLYGDARFTVLEVAPTGQDAPGAGDITAVANQKTVMVTLNGSLVDAPAWPEDAKQSEPATWVAENLPACLVFAHAAPSKPGWGEFLDTSYKRFKYVDAQTGLDAGDRTARDLKIDHDVPGEGKVRFYGGINWGGEAEVVMDYLITPPAENSVLEVFTRNTQDKYGNGSIAKLYINGRLVHQHDFGPQKVEGEEKPQWDLTIHRWRVPLEAQPGTPVLVSIATDNKGSNNADYQQWSAPRLIGGPMEAEFVEFVDGEAAPE